MRGAERSECPQTYEARSVQTYEGWIPEITFIIMGMLVLRDQYSLALTSRHFYDFIHSPQLRWWAKIRAVKAPRAQHSTGVSALILGKKAVIYMRRNMQTVSVNLTTMQALEVESGAKYSISSHDLYPLMCAGSIPTGCYRYMRVDCIINDILAKYPYLGLILYLFATFLCWVLLDLLRRIII